MMRMNWDCGFRALDGMMQSVTFGGNLEVIWLKQSSKSISVCHYSYVALLISDLANQKRKKSKTVLQTEF